MLSSSLNASSSEAAAGVLSLVGKLTTTMMARVLPITGRSFISWKTDDDDYDGKGSANNWSKPAAASCCESQSAAVAAGEKGRTH